MILIRLTAAMFFLLFSLTAPAHSAATASKQPSKPDAVAVPPEGPKIEDPNAQSLAEFFKGESQNRTSKVDFTIETGHADIKGGSAETAGRYFMDGYAIAQVAPDIYRLDVNFKKRFQRDVIGLAPEHFFTQQRSYYFWYDGGSRIVFKVGDAKTEIKIAKKELTQIKVKSLETYSVERTKLPLDIRFSDAGSLIFLQILFK